MGHHDIHRPYLYLYQAIPPLLLPSPLPRQPKVDAYTLVVQLSLCHSLALWRHRLLRLPVLARTMVFYAVLQEVRREAPVPDRWPV